MVCVTSFLSKGILLAGLFWGCWTPVSAEPLPDSAKRIEKAYLDAVSEVDTKLYKKYERQINLFFEETWRNQDQKGNPTTLRRLNRVMEKKNVSSMYDVYDWYYSSEWEECLPKPYDQKYENRKQYQKRPSEKDWRLVDELEVFGSTREVLKFKETRHSFQDKRWIKYRENEMIQVFLSDGFTSVFKRKSRYPKGFPVYDRYDDLCEQIKNDAVKARRNAAKVAVKALKAKLPEWEKSRKHISTTAWAKRKLLEWNQTAQQEESAQSIVGNWDFGTATASIADSLSFVLQFKGEEKAWTMKLKEMQGKSVHVYDVAETHQLWVAVRCGSRLVLASPTAGQKALVGRIAK